MIKKFGILFLIGLVGVYLILASCDSIIEKATQNRTYWNLKEVPKNKVGLVLGTSNRLVGGGSNPYYTNRINATLKLFKAGKIDFVISQKFHNERAIYLAEQKGLYAIGYNAEDLSIKHALKVHIREYFARVKVFIDLALNTQPKFFGEKIEIK